MTKKSPGRKRTKDPETLRYPAEGRRLRLAREAIDMTQKAICDKFGFEPTTWNAWETGQNLPNVVLLKRVHDAYGISADWIFYGDRSGLNKDVREKIAEIERLEAEREKSLVGQSRRDKGDAV